MKSASALYRLLGDETRLRLLRLVSAERLNVSELTAILGLAQSGVSRHLGLLKDAGLVSEAREGGFTYYRIAPEIRDGDRQGPLWPLLEAQFAAAASDRAVRADEARLQEVLRHRKENFETHGGERGQLVPGRSWAAWCRACDSTATSTLASPSGTCSRSPRFHSTLVTRRRHARARACFSTASERSTPTTRVAQRAASSVR